MTTISDWRWVPLAGWKQSGPAQEVVYIVDCGSTVKIGRSMRPKARVSEVLSTSGRKAVDVFVLSGSYDAVRAEGDLHKAFKAERGVGEWFAVSSAVVMETALRLEIRPHRKKKPKLTPDEVLDRIRDHFHPERRGQ
ncbi:MAG: GIY-YIG nuclease family protein [Rhodobacteraceae bacterium]|nr:GIY-YIG nuclease family protein [Paracoccaceae bacterium]